MTIVDKDLVSLFKQMYTTMDHFGQTTSEFSTMVEACKDFYDLKDYRVMSQMPYG